MHSGVEKCVKKALFLASAHLFWITFRTKSSRYSTKLVGYQIKPW